MDARRMRELVHGQQVGDLASVGPDGRPHLVPICFALIGDGERLVTAVDQKPKRSTNLRRLANIRANPEVAILFHHYEDDWDRLWWVRLNGSGRVVEEGPDREAAVRALEEKYPHYRADPPRGPAVVVDVATWRAWAAGEHR